MWKPTALNFFGVLLAAAILVDSETNAAEKTGRPVVETGPSENLVLPPPNATRSVANASTLIPWPAGKTPAAPAGFQVTLFADELDNPRSILVLPSGDVLVMESRRQVSGSRAVLLRDYQGKGQANYRRGFLSGLNAAFGMAIFDNRLFIGNTDSIMVFTYRPGDTHISERGEKILSLPVGGHYTRNVIIDQDSRKLYVAVGSRSNVDEDRHDAKDPRRAAILQTDLDGRNMRVFAGGLRNPVGMDWEPTTHQLWTAVNERDGLGDELVPDYLTSVRDGAFYGWPYSYFGQNEDPRKKGERPDLVAKAIRPDYALGSHVAPIGMTFYGGKSFPSRYNGGVFIGMHGSWNRSRPVGYKVAFVPFRNGRPNGMIEDFLTGFLADEMLNRVYGRPAGVAVWTDGSLLVADDAAGKIWRVSAKR
jgi:glucose/arabinose dehydrogenase